ncbi:hypothetical protein P152DRAFT_517095 [Eremomyces bilateralis CBS 781.70]|uniref:Uncharacterized protein n=1 Tax=Eremomyces bilateralis CBS 781.70 TaxID=1392243 RepID=A0A6G1FTN7_9PEZI|nr:uncharacterized protein P152DRAFT_517095 [Eremomyces bilateralis CBS 781.70]KAF1809086.1 hypothetical protein P152DRAFT_517095 [Eremomyces bilateralis CBS 781.70]
MVKSYRQSGRITAIRRHIEAYIEPSSKRPMLNDSDEDDIGMLFEDATEEDLRFDSFEAILGGTQAMLASELNKTMPTLDNRRELAEYQFPAEDIEDLTPVANDIESDEETATISSQTVANTETSQVTQEAPHPFAANSKYFIPSDTSLPLLRRIATQPMTNFALAMGTWVQ